MKIVLRLLRIINCFSTFLVSAGVILSLVASLSYFNPVFMLPLIVKVIKDAYNGKAGAVLKGLV